MTIIVIELIKESHFFHKSNAKIIIYYKTIFEMKGPYHLNLTIYLKFYACKDMPAARH